MQLQVLISDAINVLKENREKHIQDYKEAVDVWRKDVAEYTKALEEWAGKDVHLNRPIEPVRPRNYLAEYDKLIAKLGYHREETIALHDSEYSIIFEDNFHWQSQFQRQKAPIYTMGSPDSKNFSRESLAANGLHDAIDADSLHIPLEDVEKN